MFEQFKLGELDQVGQQLAKEMFQRQPRWAVASISEYDAAFFAGLLMRIRPMKIVEVGVASGWGSAILLEAGARVGLGHFQYYGIDIADRFFYDPSYATGQAVEEVAPSLKSHYTLLTGRGISQVATEIGKGIELSFIDAHHMHPWATLDLLSLLPFVKPNSWVALHDLSLCRKEDQEHRNRGPKYLFEGWDGDKVYSIQVPTMAGGIRIGNSPESHLPLLLDILYTPWELPVEPQFIMPLIDLLTAHFGPEWGKKFVRAFEVGNYLAKKIHSPEIDSLTSEIAMLRAAAANKIDRILGPFTKLIRR